MLSIHPHRGLADPLPRTLAWVVAAAVAVPILLWGSLWPSALMDDLPEAAAQSLLRWGAALDLAAVATLGLLWRRRHTSGQWPRWLSPGMVLTAVVAVVPCVVTFHLFEAGTATQTTCRAVVDAWRGQGPCTSSSHRRALATTGVLIAGESVLVALAVGAHTSSAPSTDGPTISRKDDSASAG